MHPTVLSLSACVLIGLLAHGFRVQTPPKSPAEKSSEKPLMCTIKDDFYGNSFAVDVKTDLKQDCSLTRNCNFFNLGTRLPPLFIEDPPHESNPGSQLGSCTCWKKNQEKILPLVEFMYNPLEQCDVQQCWTKYNQFAFLESKVPGRRNTQQSGQFWTFNCDPVDASVGGLKTYQELIAFAVERGDGSTKKEVEKMLKKEGLAPLQTDDGSEPSAALSRYLAHVRGEQKPARQVSSKSNQDPPSHVSNASSPTAVLASVSDGLVEAEIEDGQAALELALKESIQQLVDVDFEIAKMLNTAETFVSDCHAMISGSLSDADEATFRLQSLISKIDPLVGLLVNNWASSHAFKIVTLLDDDISQSDKEQIMGALKQTIDLQLDAAGKLDSATNTESMVTKTTKAWQAFEIQKDGQAALQHATSMYKMLVEMKENVVASKAQLDGILALVVE